MKNHIVFCALFFAFTLPLFGEEAGEASKENIAKLIDELEPASVLREKRRITRGEQPPEYNDQDKKHAAETIDKAKEIVPRLRKLLKVGSSIFDYPGLLSKGDIRFNSNEKTYGLYVGVSFVRAGGQGSSPYAFTVHFDDKGKILDIADVVWKK